MILQTETYWEMNGERKREKNRRKGQMQEMPLVG